MPQRMTQILQKTENIKPVAENIITTDLGGYVALQHLAPHEFFICGSREDFQYGLYLGKTDLGNCTSVFFPKRPKLLAPRITPISAETRVIPLRRRIHITHSYNYDAFKFHHNRDFWPGDIVLHGEAQLLACATHPYGPIFLDLKTFSFEQEPAYGHSVIVEKWQIQTPSQLDPSMSTALYEYSQEDVG